MKKTGSKIIGVFAAIAAVVVLASSIVVTYPNEYKLIKQFGEIVDVVEAPGVFLQDPVYPGERIRTEGTSDL